MRCPKCITEGQRSRVTADRASAVAAVWRDTSHLHYWDEDGRRHDHAEWDPSRPSRYKCSAGHHFEAHVPKVCWCGHNDGKNPVVVIMEPEGPMHPPRPHRVTDPDVLRAVVTAAKPETRDA